MVVAGVGLSVEAGKMKVGRKVVAADGLLVEAGIVVVGLVELGWYPCSSDFMVLVKMKEFISSRSRVQRRVPRRFS